MIAAIISVTLVSLFILSQGLSAHHARNEALHQHLSQQTHTMPPLQHENAVLKTPTAKTPIVTLDGVAVENLNKDK